MEPQICGDLEEIRLGKLPPFVFLAGVAEGQRGRYERERRIRGDRA
jgi:hypothetical protein